MSWGVSSVVNLQDGARTSVREPEAIERVIGAASAHGIEPHGLNERDEEVVVRAAREFPLFTALVGDVLPRLEEPLRVSDGEPGEVVERVRAARNVRDADDERVIEQRLAVGFGEGVEEVEELVAKVRDQRATWGDKKKQNWQKMKIATFKLVRKSI